LKQRIRLAVLASLSLFIASCGERPEQVLAPRPVFDLAPAASCTATESDIYALIDLLYSDGNEGQAANARFDAISKQLAKGTASDSQTAKGQTLDLVDFTVRKYKNGQLLDPPGDQTTEEAVYELANSLLCFAGLPLLPDGSLDPDGALALIFPTTDSTVRVGTGNAGVNFDVGDVSEPILVSITRILPDAPGPLATLLDQYPRYYEFSMSPVLPQFSQPVEVAVCVPEGLVDAVTFGRLRLAHNLATPSGPVLEILETIAPEVVADIVFCSEESASRHGAFGLFDLASAVMRPVVRTLLPRPLMASAMFATGGVGGTTRNFSPFGAVDPLVEMEATSALHQNYPIGGTVPSAPAVQLHTPNGTLFPGLSVAFAVGDGGGSVTGAAQTTDLNGAAAVGSWTLGLTPGLNTVTATATPPHAGSYVQPAPLNFTANATQATTLWFAVQPVGTTADLTLAPVQVAVRDDYANVVGVSTAPVTMGLGTAPAGATLGGTTTVNAAGGIATFADLFLRTAGAYTLVATSDPLTGATSDPFTISAGAATAVVKVAGDGQTALEGTVLPIAPSVRVDDAYGNPVAGVNVVFQIASGGGSLTGATQTTGTSGIATVGSWTISAGTNTLYASAYAGATFVGTVTFTATGTSSLMTIADCAPSNGAGDDLSRGFYYPNAGNNRISRLGTVTLYMSSNDQASTPTPYTVRMTARSGSFGGSVIGTADAQVAFRGTSSQNTPVNFVFSNSAVPSNAAVAFSLQILSSGPGARGGVTFNTGPCGLGDSRCKTSCPVIETSNTTGTDLTAIFRRKGCGIRIIGSR
jgi:hypothetical protein